MNEREALLRAVCDNPDDDTPRLVFADWLQEHGDEARAEFIRVQIALARGDASASLKEREQELLTAHGETWTQPFRQFEAGSSWGQFVRDVHYHRGFVWSIEVYDAECRFAEHSFELFQLAPIQRIVFIEKNQHADLAECPELLRVKELSIDRAGFEAKELEELFRLKVLVNVNRLELIADDDNAHLTSEGIELLSRATNLPALRHLDLSGNWCNWLRMGTDWLEHLLEGPLIGQLESLRLGKTGMEDLHAETLARSEQIRSLKHLDLSGNMFGDRGLRALATSPHFAKLLVLDLRENYFPDDGAEDVACTPETRQLLEAHFGDRVLLDEEKDSRPLP